MTTYDFLWYRKYRVPFRYYFLRKNALVYRRCWPNIEIYLRFTNLIVVYAKILSPWYSNVVPVLRRSKQTEEVRFRLAIDLRNVNRVCNSCQQPLPNAEGETLNLRGQSVLSQLDFKSAFYSVQLSERAQQILSIRVENQQYQFCRLTFGYIATPQTYA